MIVATVGDLQPLRDGRVEMSNDDDDDDDDDAQWTNDGRRGEMAVFRTTIDSSLRESPVRLSRRREWETLRGMRR